MHRDLYRLGKVQGALVKGSQNYFANEIFL